MSESARGRRQKWRGRVPNKHAHSNIAVIGSELRHLLARSLSRVDDDVMSHSSDDDHDVDDDDSWTHAAGDDDEGLTIDAPRGASNTCTIMM